MGHFNFVPNTEIKILKNIYMIYTVIECTIESLKLLHVFVKLSRLFNIIFDYLIATHAVNLLYLACTIFGGN